MFHQLLSVRSNEHNNWILKQQHEDERRHVRDEIQPENDYRH